MGNAIQGKPTILIVDDTPDSLDILVRSLRVEYRVLFAVNGPLALNIAQCNPQPDIILLDVTMPVMDGFEVCRQLKLDPSTQDIPVIFLTARDSETDEQYGLSLGALDYVSKPFSMATVRARIQNHIRLARQEKHLKQEIAERQAAYEKLKVADLVFHNTSEAIMLTDAENRIIAVNPAFSTVTGYDEQEAIGKTPKLLKSGYHDPAFFQTLWHSLETTGIWQGEIWNRRKNGDLYAEWLTINTIYFEDGAVRQRVALFSDITRKKKLEEEIWMQANFDPLTGLANRRRFYDQLSLEIMRAKREARSLALLFIDLDGFKQVNDTLGHDMGDELLIEAGNRLLRCVRESDTLARLGGDEFTVILDNTSEPDGIDRVAQCITQTLSEPFLLGKHNASISASIGIARYPENGSDSTSLLKNADRAMYDAKARGRNRYCYFSSLA